MNKITVKENNKVENNPKTPKNAHEPLRYHLCGLAHTITRLDYAHCAFTKKILDFDRMMTKRGHYGIHYGNPGADVISEHVDVVNEDFYNKHFAANIGSPNHFWELHEFSDFTLTYNMKMCAEIRLRAQPGDIVIITIGTWAEKIAELLSDIPDLIIVEAFTAYSCGKRSPHRIYESYTVQDFNKGRFDMMWDIHEHNENPPPEAVPNTTPQFLDDVVQLYIDENLFDYSDKKGDYFLYMGRVMWTKGLDIAVKTCETLGEKLIVAGQGDINEALGYTPPANVEVLGNIDVDARRKLMTNAKGGWVCTYYCEPGPNAVPEFLLSGTPVITTDWGNMPFINLNGITGYRVRSGAEAIQAVKQINAGHIKSEHCRKWGMNFGLDRQARAFEYYFRRLRDAAKNNDNEYTLYYNQTDIDLSVRDMIHPKDPDYDINLNPVT